MTKLLKLADDDFKKLLWIWSTIKKKADITIRETDYKRKINNMAENTVLQIKNLLGEYNSILDKVEANIKLTWL